MGAVIANIMSRETGIRFAYCQPDCNTLASVVFEESYPWMANETEKELTEKNYQIFVRNIWMNLG